MVDDDRDACELFATVLRQAGYAAEAVVNGFEALARAKAVRPDLVLTDLQMPGMSGIELIHGLHAIDRDLPVVLTTGTETHDLCTSAQGYGAVACLPKPVNLDELLWTIDCALACRREAGLGYRGATASA